MVETVVLDDRYHMVTLDRQRHVVVDRSLDFVDRLVAAEQARACVVRPLADRQLAASRAAE